MSYILCIGESLVDFLAQTEVADVGASDLFSRCAGGAVSNVAAGIARLGGAARFAGTLGSDPFGKFLLSTLAYENVNVDNVRLVDAHTTLAFVARDEAGRPEFFFVRSPGADSQLQSSDIASEQIEHAAVVHFGGVLLASDPARSACLHAAQSASTCGTLVSFDMNARPSLFASREEMRDILLHGAGLAQLVRVSEDDLQALDLKTGEPGIFFRGLTRAVVVTRGERGLSWYMRSGEHADIAAPKIRVVDTTGAGDAATAALLWRLQHNHNCELAATALQDGARYACAAGTVACVREGAIPSLPTVKELDAMLARM